jgi:Glycine zipper
VFLGGCVSDGAPRTQASISAQAYQADLDSCQSAAAVARTANGAEGLLTGALLGAAYGAAAGAHRGGADIGAIVGASVGAVAGFVQGMRWPRGTSVSACMHAKGYRRI